MAAALRQALSEAYGIDGEDVDGLIEAVKNGKVKDEAYYEELAQQRGVSVKTAQQADKAAARAEGSAPKDGTVLRVNGKGGAVHRCIHSVGHLIEGHAAAAGLPLRFAAAAEYYRRDHD